MLFTRPDNCEPDSRQSKTRREYSEYTTGNSLAVKLKHLHLKNKIGYNSCVK